MFDILYIASEKHFTYFFFAIFKLKKTLTISLLLHYFIRKMEIYLKITPKSLV